MVERVVRPQTQVSLRSELIAQWGRSISTDKPNLTQLLEVLSTASECSGSKKTGEKTFLEEGIRGKNDFSARP